MKALLVYPEHPSLTYWSFRHTLPYIERRAALPPLGLVTVAAMLPEDWQVRLVDMNVTPLRDADLAWADVVMTSTMLVQAPSHVGVVERCNRMQVPVVAGGPYPSATPERLTAAGVDTVFVGEAEGHMEELCADLEAGRPRRLYRAAGLPDVGASPVPRFDLLDLDAYASMAVQHSRGCPFACEFCDIWTLYGRKSRVKAPEQMTAELDALRDAGWQGATFFVDDNFIGNRGQAKRSLAALQIWQQARGYPLKFYTEASVNLGSDDELMTGMRDAGFDFVFLGIESPSEESLQGANKPVNAHLDLYDVVRRIQAHGMEVSSGFIVGFDEDTEDIFDRQVEFIREAGIPLAMVGILTAVEGTDLHARLRREGRLLAESEGNNTHAFTPNFVPRMPVERLVAGYKRVMQALYAPDLRDYFDRCRLLLDRLGPNDLFARRPAANEIRALLRSLKVIPSRRYGRQYLRFLLWCLRRHPSRFAEGVRLGIQGFHFEAITREALAPRAGARRLARLRQIFHRDVERLLARYTDARDRGARGMADLAREVDALNRRRRAVLKRARRHVRSLPREYRLLGRLELARLRQHLDALLPDWPDRPQPHGA